MYYFSGIFTVSGAVRDMFQIIICPYFQFPIADVSENNMLLFLLKNYEI